jgi:hypothetical protein
MRIPLTYITDELAFDDCTATHEFLSKWQAAIYVPEPAPKPITAKPISISLSAPPKIAKPSNGRDKKDDMDIDKEKEQDKRIFDCKAAHPYLSAASQTFTKVDIKVGFRRRGNHDLLTR